MKVFISQKVDVSLEEIKQGLAFSEYKEMADYFSYQDDFKEEMIEAIGLDESAHLANISDDYMNRYIRDNLDYYKATIEMQNKISQLKYSLTEIEAKNSKPCIPNNPDEAHKFFCDLFDLGYYTDKAEILKRINQAM